MVACERKLRPAWKNGWQLGWPLATFRWWYACDFSATLRFRLLRLFGDATLLPFANFGRAAFDSCKFRSSFVRFLELRSSYFRLLGSSGERFWLLATFPHVVRHDSQSGETFLFWGDVLFWGDFLTCTYLMRRSLFPRCQLGFFCPYPKTVSLHHWWHLDSSARTLRWSYK